MESITSSPIETPFDSGSSSDLSDYEDFQEWKNKDNPSQPLSEQAQWLHFRESEKDCYNALFLVRPWINSVLDLKAVFFL